MIANPLFSNKSNEFWSLIRLVSERMGYSKHNQIISYQYKETREMLNNLGIQINDIVLSEILTYFEFRKNCLNIFVSKQLMDVDKARTAFYRLKNYYDDNNFICSLPLNKQKNEKRDYAYFTGIINIITEKTLREIACDRGLKYGKSGDLFFNDNPLNLSYIYDKNGLQYTLSRRFDGAFPDTANPIAIWEIKEYYYTTTFGSRIADGVYETQLDGHEVKELTERTGYKLKHIYFVDDYNTWWNMGKSYLCRIIDMLNMGLVDEVIFGQEVFTRWPALLQEIVDTQ